MAIPIIKPSIGPEVASLTHTSERFSFPGLTTQGNIFLHDLVDDTWFIFDPTTGGTDGAYVQINTTLEDLKTSSQSYQIKVFNTNVQTLISDTVRSYNYDSADNFISYYNSLDPIKREEARSFSDWRDSVLSLADTNIYGFTADGITLPDLAGFTGQDGYIDYEVSPIPTTFFGDEDAGYHITDLENRIFTAWINVDHQGINSGLGQSVQIPFPSGNITDIYSISGIVDQGSQTSDWLNANYSLKVKFSGTANSYGVQTEFDYMIHSLDGYATTYNGLVPRFTIIGGY